MPARIEGTLNTLTAFTEEWKQYLATQLKWWSLLWKNLSSLTLETKSAGLSRFELRTIDALCSLLLYEPSACVLVS